MKKLNLKELELKLPKINESYSKILLGGDSYGDDDCAIGCGGDLIRPRELDDIDIGWDGPLDYDNSYDLDTSMDGQSDDDGQPEEEPDYNLGGHHPIDDTGVPPVQMVQLPNLPTATPVQPYAGACVPANASFVSGYYGVTQSVDDMVHDYAVAHNLNAIQELYILNNGFDESSQVAFLMQEFNMYGLNSAPQIVQAIDNGRPVITNMLDGGSQLDPYGGTVLTGHEVTVVGYDSATNQFMVYDSITGSYLNVSQSDINFTIQGWEIVSVKP